MKLRAIHLIRKLDQIDRDLMELEALQNRIKGDRQYAGRLMSSLADEAVRLKGLRDKILHQVIKNPPESLAAAPNPAELAAPEGASAEPAAGDASGPRVIVPAAPRAKKTRSKTASRRTGKSSAPQTAASTEPEAAAKKSDDGSSFQFRYN